ncbi:hypothetical protein PPYR_03432 [Photinus pyralis]|uniref:Ran-specific GTPase-activating protein n=2 Tax=Photinus pyralis TaxID=7054 RepID=A0A5N4A2V3_PHOPY|nr:ran-specific GTPase-activating protein-like [Photinus pyralis]KAB0791632.1 hypothetical protein PPYR_03432 [Photinus pyralis]
MTEAINNTRDRTLSGSSATSDTDVDPHFEPIITLPEVKVVPDEETQDLLLKVRAKLYRFDSSNEEGPEWKERGTGEVKFLQHKQNNSVRIVMRRDKTFKVCANHFITPWMELKPSAGTDKAFVYTVAADFADEEIKSECLAIKFASVEHANLFKEKFEECINIVKTKCDLYINDFKENNLNKCAEEVTEKISQLNVSKEENEK